jgi:N-acyl-D-aspartate/D-glutamate deacylase
MMRSAAVFALALWLAACARPPESFDLVLQGGRVIDPETGLDAVRDVGIRGGMVVRISSKPLTGTRMIQATGLVVSPGFIDLNQHEHDAASYRLEALDGVTTALELEAGVPDVARFLELRRGKTPINFGASASHEAARVLAFGVPLGDSPFGPAAAIPNPSIGPATNDPASQEHLQRILDILRAQVEAGGLGIGISLEYTPGATRHEIIEVFRLAAEYKQPVIVHVRSAGRLEPGSAIEAINEVIGAAAVTGAAVHINHINSNCLGDSPECLRMIEGARARGLDVTTEAYPYGVAMTFITGAYFAPGWRERRNIDYGDLELPGTGERLTRERFETLHAAPTPRLVLIHVNPDAVVDAVITNPHVMIASDGIKGHPRLAGTCARILARYVRSQGTMSLLGAVRKLSLMPAQRLETARQAARRKGRLQEGADADIVVFDPERIEDLATYSSAFEPSKGVRHLIVAGTIVVNDGLFVEGVNPGQALRGDAGQKKPRL